MSVVVNGKIIDLDHEGNLLEPADWSKDVAYASAKKENIQMTDEVCEVVNFVRDYYDERRSVPEHRVFLQALRKRHGKEIATPKYVYNMFPYCYGQQACKIAGMRVPLKLLLDL